MQVRRWMRQKQTKCVRHTVVTKVFLMMFSKKISVKVHSYKATSLSCN